VALIAALALAGRATAADAPSIELLSSRQLDPRLVELTLSTPALAAPTHVRVLLPDGYGSDARHRYPVLYLLHGGNDDYTSWTAPGKGDAERLTAGLPLIVVMPDAGKGGWYTDWFNNGAFGRPEWETYHVGQLIGWIDDHYRTIAGRSGRAVAGLSMGGFGAMSYAARHPDLFVSAASFSGAVDTNVPPVVGRAFIDALSGLDGAPPGSLWGPPATQEVRWRGHNPWDLAQNLRGLSLALHTGNGEAGGPFGGGPNDVLETAVHEESVSLHQRLDALGIPHLWDDYGPGGHLWAYWRRDLAQTLPLFMASFAQPPPPPSPVDFTAIEPQYGAYGWQVSLDRPVLEFSTLRDASRNGFTLSGSGSATVTTPRGFHGNYAISIDPQDGPPQFERLHADRGGRLVIPVPLGPPNPFQQFTPQAAIAGTRLFSTEVRISRGAVGNRRSPAAVPEAEPLR
jgi:S-formylglutathione hydrolase FrmB